MIELELRELQLESARAIATMEATNNNLSQFNKQAHHNSQQWYEVIINWYIDQYGDLPSKVGPGKEVRLISDV
jgi:hypothetical protein